MPIANNKVRISITIMPSINNLLEEISGKTKTSKSELVEKAVKQYFRAQLETDLKKLAKIKFDDLPSEDEWLNLCPAINL